MSHNSGPRKPGAGYEGICNLDLDEFLTEVGVVQIEISSFKTELDVIY